MLKNTRFRHFTEAIFETNVRLRCMLRRNVHILRGIEQADLGSLHQSSMVFNTTNYSWKKLSKPVNQMFSSSIHICSRDCTHMQFDDAKGLHNLEYIVSESEAAYSR
jgi:hypothetical protein